MSEKPSTPDSSLSERLFSALGEIIQPFRDLAHAPRALWGINLAYVLEGMCYFGVLGYLAIHFSDFVFQGIEHADEFSHNSVMILTAGITIAMFFLGSIADKWGVRFALIAAFICMIIGRGFMSGAPNVLGLEPPRPGVFAGDTVSLYVTELETKDGKKTITAATVLANDEAGARGEDDGVPDLAAGDGMALSKELESKLVRLSQARVLKGEGQEWEVEYGEASVTGKLLIQTADVLGLRPGALISLRHAYIEERQKEEEDKTIVGRIVEVFSGWFGDEDVLPGKLTRGSDDEFVIGFGDRPSWEKEEAEEPDLVIRSHWFEDVVAVNTFPLDLAEGDGIEPDGSLTSNGVCISEARLVKGDGDGEWTVQYGNKPVVAQWFNRSPEEIGLCDGATFSISQARVTKEGDTKIALRFDWREDMAVLDNSVCSATGQVEDVLPRDLAAGKGLAPGSDVAGHDLILSEAVLVGGSGHEWQIEYGDGPVTSKLILESTDDVGICVGGRISLRNVGVVPDGEKDGGYVLQAGWPKDVLAVDTYGCDECPYSAMVTSHEKSLRSPSRWPVAEPSEEANEADRLGIGDLLKLEDGPVSVVLENVQVSYVRNGGYFVEDQGGEAAAFAFVNPVWSPLHLVTVLGIVLVVIGYGMYQPAAYAGVRAFTTPKTAAMGFAMLYALMNLGGWLPSFAFLIRDENFLGFGIPGTYWFYTGCTVLALLCTVVILSRKTVANAIARAKAETAEIEAAEKKEKGEAKVAADESKKGQEAVPAESSGRVPVHMWLLSAAFLVALYVRVSAPWNLYSVCAIGAIWVVLTIVPPTARWLARHPLADAKFFFFIFALIPVQTLFTYNWLILPQYISRAFEGWIGEYFELASNANPILIFILVPIITAITQKAKVYNMMILGTFIMAAPAFLLTMGPHWWTLFPYIMIMTVGEAMWQPRFLQYAAEIAPEGRTGQYMGVAQLPWFLTKVLVPWLYSGWMMDRYCPAEGEQNTAAMWMIFACIAMCSTVFLILAKGWVGKDFKTKAD